MIEDINNNSLSFYIHIQIFYILRCEIDVLQYNKFSLYPFKFVYNMEGGGIKYI